MKTYEVEIDEICKHLEQVVLLVTGGFGTGNAGAIKRLKAAMQLRGLGRKAFALMNEIASEPEPEPKRESLQDPRCKHPLIMVDGEGFTKGVS